jgi:RHS repeat-associated protein
VVDYQVTYTYDALNRRIGEQIDADGAGSGTPVQTWTVFDGQNPYADFNGAGTLTQRYLHGAAVDALLARTDASGVTNWYLSDRLGSVRDIVDVSGNVVYHTGYDSFGNNISTSGTGGDRFGFTGREHDAALNLYYNRARFYDPATGRFLSRDPIGFEAGDANLFRYVGNGPTNGIDPSGLAEKPPVKMGRDRSGIKNPGRPNNPIGRDINPPTTNSPGWVYPWEPGADWMDWRIGQAAVDSISRISGTVGVGASGEIYLGRYHFQVTGIAVIAIDVQSRKLTPGLIISHQGGDRGAIGIGTSLGPVGFIANTGDLNDFRGPGGAVGISTPIGGIDVGIPIVPEDTGIPPWWSFSVSTAGPVIGTHVEQTKTWIVTKEDMQNIISP